MQWNAQPGAYLHRVLRTQAGGGAPSEFLVEGVGFTDDEVYNGFSYTYAVSAISDAGEGEPSLVQGTPAPGAVPALLVVGKAALGSGDAALLGRLQALGYTVTVKTAGSVATADAAGKRLVLIAATVGPLKVNTKFRDVAVPVLVCDPAVLDDMGMTGAVSGTDFGTRKAQSAVAILSPGHPMAAGLSGSAVQVVTTAQTFSWGLPAASAARVAALPSNSNRVLIFAYEAGTGMAGAIPAVAPARRVGFFLHDAAAASLNGAGWSLFESALAWMIGGPSAPAFLRLTEGSGTVRLTWMEVEGALSYNVLRSTDGVTFVQVAAGVSTSSWTDSAVTDGIAYTYKVVAVGSGSIGMPSASVTGTPTVLSLVLSPLGPRMIWARRPDKPYSAIYNEGQYDILARISDANGYYTANLTGAVGDLTLTPIVAGNHAPLVVTKLSETSFRIKAMTPEENIEDRSWWLAEYVMEHPTYGRKVLIFGIIVGAQHNMHVHYHFPRAASGPGQTLRQWPPGSTNRFFDTNDTVRGSARSSFTADLTDKVNLILKQSGIWLYDTMSSHIEDPLTGWTSGGAYDLDSIERLELRDEAKESKTIHIYLVRDVVPTDGITYGITSTTLANRVRQGHIIFLTDHDQAGGVSLPSVLAHEVGHSLGLLHYEYDGWPQFGELNNTDKVTGDIKTPPGNLNHPLHWNLMRTETSTAPTWLWFDQKQASEMWVNGLAHPAFMWKD